MPEINYFWDEVEDNITREYDETNITIVTYTTEPARFGSVINQSRNGDIGTFHYDGLGNTVELTDEIANVTLVRRYSAFGDVVLQSGSAECSLQFGGRWGYQRDGYIRRRIYNVIHGRWTSVDPLFAQSVRPSDFLFVANRPTIRSDASGLLWQSTVYTEVPWTSLPPDVAIKPKSICGSFGLLTRWHINDGEENGLIIQRVCNGFKGEPCKNSPLKLCNISVTRPDWPAFNSGTCVGCYFELWRVFQGAAYTTNVLDDAPGNLPGTTGGVEWLDWFVAFGFGSRTKGERWQEGVAIFIPDSDWQNGCEVLHWLGLFGVGGNGVAGAGFLTSKCEDSDLDKLVWQLLLGQYGASSTKKRVWFDWDCCVKPPWTFLLVAITQ